MSPASHEGVEGRSGWAGRVTAAVLGAAGRLGSSGPPDCEELPTATSRLIGSGWVWFGAHGGAGVTTLCAAVPGGYDAARCWPAERDRPVVVVARSDARGLIAAQQVAIAAAPGGPWEDHLVVGLVVISDQPRRLPRPLVELGQLVSGGYGRVWQIPYVQRWRLGADPATGSLPVAVRRLAADLADLCAPPPDQPPPARAQPFTLTRSNQC